MKSSKVLFDTSVYIAYKTILFSRGEPGWYAVVVAQERVVGGRDKTELKLLESECKVYERKDRLLLPTRKPG